MKRIISLLLIVATLFATLTINVGAARQEEYLSEVALVYEDSIEDAKKAIEGTDWKLLEHDLNANADYMIDDGVYLIYKTSTNVEDAITDLRIMDMYGGYSTSNYKKQLEASRKEYMKAVSYIRIASAEFRELYKAGDEMAKLAYRQMNYYKDVGETDMFMGDFLLNIPSDEALVTAMMEGNMYVVTNLISLLAIGISGGSDKNLAERIVEKYEVRDTLTDTHYYDATTALIDEFRELAAIIKRYDALADQYDLTDEDVSEEEFQFIANYASIAMILDRIPYGDVSLKEFIVKDDLTAKDLYPVIAALSEGQMALVDIGALTTVLRYNAPSKSIDELYKVVRETEREITDENGNLKIFNVYAGVDRSIFKGNFAFTTAAERQQALTGVEWTSDYYMLNKMEDEVPYALVGSLAAAGSVVGLVPLGMYKLTAPVAAAALRAGQAGAMKTIEYKIASFLLGSGKYAAVNPLKIFVAAGVGLIVAAFGVAGISMWYGYYNPDYTPIPNVMVDVKETDLGDKYVKYTAAKVYEDGALSEKNADLNAYEGKEWNALYYTKDATAGNCLTANFVFSDSSSAVARRYQGISMFGETDAFNLNSHVFNADAKGAYLTVRYSTAKKTAAEVPTVVGSIFSGGGLYVVAALGGAVVGIGGTLLLQKAAKAKKKEAA